MTMFFDDFQFSYDILDAIDQMGFQNPTPIQEMAIPLILENKDLIACAQTGTGKTAAFILPILDKILENHQHKTSTLIIVPTRELAMQIDQQIQGFAYFTSITSLAVYGGGSGEEWVQQKKALSSGVDIVVATPGKLISHLANSYVKFDKIDHLILDEADRMLDMGFFDDIMKIIGHLPKERQSLMFSATMPHEIRKLAKSILKKPEEINLGLSKPAEGVTQKVILAYNPQKTKLLKHILQEKKDFSSVLIFSSTKKKVFEIYHALKRSPFTVEAISSDLEQNQREEVLRNFKSRKTKVLVATDVLSRGIDIKEIDLVINFDVPNDAEDYVHRVGRTARADSKGEAITLVNPDDMRKFQKIEKLIETNLEKLQPPKELGEGPKWETFRKPKKNFKSKGPRKNFKKKGHSKTKKS